ncbi:MAG: YybH family protein [Cyclobacteriaceae bacterium]
MKRFENKRVPNSIFFYFLVFTIISVIGSCGNNQQAEIEAIKAVSNARAEAFNQGNAAGIAEYFTEDAILMPPNQPSMVGRDAVADYYQSIFDEFHTELESGYKEVEVSGDMAYGRGYAKVKLSPKSGGEVVESESEYINILKKQPDNSWKTTHDIWNSSE